MKEKEKIYKHWKEWLDEDGFVPVEVQEERLNCLSSYIKKYCELKPSKYSMDSAYNQILIPNMNVIKEYDSTFIELMSNHSHKYDTKRMIPIQIIRSLIDVGTVLQAFIDSSDKVSFINKYHKGEKNSRIDKHTITYYVEEINKRYSFIKGLYDECCKYVHSCYYRAKAHSTWAYSTQPGKTGFMGSYYKVKYEDFLNELEEGIISKEDLPFDYEEEIDIINYCIKVNDVLLELVKEVLKFDEKINIK